MAPPRARARARARAEILALTFTLTLALALTCDVVSSAAAVRALHVDGHPLRQHAVPGVIPHGEVRVLHQDERHTPAHIHLRVYSTAWSVRLGVGGLGMMLFGLWLRV